MPFSDLVAQVTDFLVLGGPVVSLIGVLSVVALAIILIKLAQFLIEGVGRRARAERAVGLWVHGRHIEARQLLAGARGPSGQAVSATCRPSANTERARRGSRTRWHGSRPSGSTVSDVASALWTPLAS